MLVMVVADDESLLNSWEGAQAQVDLLISCGDIADQIILEVARRSNCSRVLAVKGNHDSSGELPPQICDLHLNVVEFGGLKFGGFAGAWKYKLKGNFLFEQQEVSSMTSWFPMVDVFVAHNSPRGIHDRDDDVHLGFDAFNTYIKRANPRVFLHGHQHVSTETVVGDTRVLGTYGVRTLTI
jgi:Icc-related predicted phosphoesterase